MTGDVDTESATATADAMRSFNRFLYAYLALLIIAFLGLLRLFGFPTATAVALAGHLLIHAPLFTLIGNMRARTDESVATVCDELSSVANPLTSLWLTDAAQIETDSDAGAVHFRRNGPLGLTSKQYRLVATERPDETIVLTISRDKRSIVTARASVESVETGTRVTLTVERTDVHALSLLMMMLLGSTVDRLYAAHGYDIVDDSHSVGLRVPW
ncbi:hypothetical protein Halru_2622 [Halovivax ruber XH-70]|uniref:Uncharacterized protein n=1 Tax=Halovivax ruber (strain DSM 18193 / JCM 13892 / XH-70) TaxID=797302 RepID=L0ICA1_HALRX|nr:hypothetical protein [Halovivax ruber]AGB17200.1 hypothetical protein Halru_2622 [Halovivax ruber XH-70]